MQTTPLRRSLAGAAQGLAASPTIAAIRARLRVAAIVAVALLPVTLIASYAKARALGGTPEDYSVFGPAGANLLRGRWDLVYAAQNNQGGPFELLPYGVARVLQVHGTVGWTIFYVVALTVVVFVLGLVLFAPLGPISGRPIFYITLGVAALGVLTGYLTEAVFTGHPAELMIPFLWIVGASLARDRHFIASAVAIGLSVGFESWGTLGFALVFVVARPRLVRAALAGLVTMAIIYVPFLATGVFRQFDFQWLVYPDTIYGLFFPQLHLFTWSLRLLQAGSAVVVGLAVALLARRSRYVVWLAPLAIVAARLVLDPMLLAYYWVSVAAVALAALGAAIYLRAWIPAVIAFVIVAWFWHPLADSAFSVLTLLLLVLACAVFVYFWCRRTQVSAGLTDIRARDGV